MLNTGVSYQPKLFKENTQAGLPSTLIRHENGAFRKRSSNRGIWKRQLEGRYFENGASRRRWRHDNHVISLIEFSSNTNPKWQVIDAFSNSFGVVWTGPEKCVHFWKTSVATRLVWNVERIAKLWKFVIALSPVLSLPSNGAPSERVSMGQWLLRLTVNFWAFLCLTVKFLNLLPLRLTEILIISYYCLTLQYSN